MNTLLVTGRGVGIDSGVCRACDYDFDWLITHPSVLVWADRILVTDTIWQVIEAEDHPSRPMARSLKLVLELAKAHGLVEVRRASPWLNSDLGGIISAQAERDVDEIGSAFPGKVKVRNISRDEGVRFDELIIDGDHYCIPYIGSVYSSLLLARAWNANCLFNREAVGYLCYKFGAAGLPGEAESRRLASFTTVFEAYFPNDRLIPHFALDSDGKCAVCVHSDSCSERYLQDLEAETAERLKWRDYDEVQEARSVLAAIVAAQGTAADGPDPAEVAREFGERQRALMRRNLSVFPKVRRWSNVVTIASAPLAVFGLATGAPLIALTGAGLAGLAQVGKEYMSFLESNSRWVGFLQNLLDKKPALPPPSPPGRD